MIFQKLSDGSCRVKDAIGYTGPISSMEQKYKNRVKNIIKQWGVENVKSDISKNKRSALIDIYIAAHVPSEQRNEKDVLSILNSL